MPRITFRRPLNREVPQVESRPGVFVPLTFYSAERPPPLGIAASVNRKLLYDMDQDPGEVHDIARENPSRVEELSRLLGSWRQVQIMCYSTLYFYGRYYPFILEMARSKTKG